MEVKVCEGSQNQFQTSELEISSITFFCDTSDCEFLRDARKHGKVVE